MTDQTTNPWADEEPTSKTVKPAKAAAPKKNLEQQLATQVEYDLDGLMTDFPTARDLERFVFDETGIVLNLKGRSNKLKYQVAMDVLNGGKPPAEVIGTENPYLDKVELIPEEPFKTDFARDPEIDLAGPEVTRFGTSVFPHPDPEWRARDQKCQVVFRKYMNGTITYEVLGPVAKRAVGTKINKFGQKQPEKYVWIDPRTGEQIIRNAAGKLTPLGTRLQAFMKKQRVNKSNHWDTWIDRDFVASDNAIVDNPWAV
jgi:hypothetical protein